MNSIDFIDVDSTVLLLSPFQEGNLYITVPFVLFKSTSLKRATTLEKNK
jgi:hypothetical protein